MELSATVQRSNLWKQTLSPRENDFAASQRERFRSEFMKFRERASLLADEIRKDVPDLTVHGITHLDSLWEMSSLITGEGINFTATEGFVLGGAILLHDMATSIAATPGGYGGLVSDPKWHDIVHSEYHLLFGRSPSPQEIETPDPTIKNRALFKLLRLTHAQNAETLATRPYPLPGREQIFLIDDPELRHTFGRAIGQIAHSHWWSLSKIKSVFDKPPVGAPHWCPAEWTVNPLKLACALRVADAAHLDARRAPMFLRAISNISQGSRQHWDFQQRMNKPYVKDDALVFSSGAAFDLTEAPAWWLCLDTLRMVDRELRGVDTLLADIGQPRFAARRVAGVDSPDRLISYIQTDGWLPINATVHVTDLPRIIRSIGGDELYGKSPHVALRELIQNSRDAIVARKIYENRDSDFGAISVSLTKTGEAYWLEVTDDGIGMSQRTLTNFLLDFGSSFWGSQEMMEEFPGLLSSGMSAVGGFGIGFFSVFMIAQNVEVITRKAGDAARDTLVLEFSSGLTGRPILRQAAKSEQMVNDGTRVRLRLLCPPDEPGGLLRGRREKP